MKSEDHRAQVLRALERALAADHARTQIHPFSPLGLIEMTRKRTRESLGHILCEPCPACDGRGTIKTMETVCHERSEEHTSELQSLMRTSYAVFCLTKKHKNI